MEQEMTGNSGDRTAVLEARLQKLQDTLDNLAYHDMIEGYSELGRVLGVSPPTAKKLVDGGQIPCVKMSGKVFVQRGDALRLRKPSAVSGLWEITARNGGYRLTCGGLRADIKGDRVLITRHGHPVDVRKACAVDTPAKFLDALIKNL